MDPISIVTMGFLASAWSAKDSCCRPSSLVKLHLGEQVATIRATRSVLDGIHIG
jgi:hypothetical protein